MDHGEVYTNPREVNAMLNLVKRETERIESRFLEPACGTGNFLIEILDRKLSIVSGRYRKSQIEFERKATLAITSLYGIDILYDNVIECSVRLINLFNHYYDKQYNNNVKSSCKKTIRFIIERNIVWGDALTLKTVEENPKPIVFSEWSFPFNNSMIKRRDFEFSDLIQNKEKFNQKLFSNPPLLSDTGERVFIPKEISNFEPIHFLRVGEKYEDK